MNTNAPPLSQQVVFPEKEVKPELFKAEVCPCSEVMDFNGSIVRLNSNLWIDGEMVSDKIKMKPNYMCAISQTNKRYITENLGVLTDYVEPNPLLFRALGFSEEECKTLLYAKKVNSFPFGFWLKGYDCDNLKYSKPKIDYVSIDGEDISSREDAIKILAIWLNENNYAPSMNLFSEKEESFEVYYSKHRISKEAREFAAAYQILPKYFVFAEEIFYTLEHICRNVFQALSEKYEKKDILLVDTILVFGMDLKGKIRLSGEIGTPNTSLLAHKDFYEKEKILDSIDTSSIRSYINKIKTMCIAKGEKVPEKIKIPEDILESVTNAYMYLVNRLADEPEMNLYI